MAEPIKGPVAELIERKFFVDELYETVFVRFGGRRRPTRWPGSTPGSSTGAVNGAGGASTAIGRSAGDPDRLVRGYVGAMVLGALVLVAVLLVQVGDRWTTS
jgi:hypothetical protein